MITKFKSPLQMCIAAVLMPCLIGIVSMIHEGVSVAIWIQNPLMILLAAIVCMIASQRGMKVPARWTLLAAMLLLALTFAGPDAQGVHRWVRLAGFSLHASALVLPTAIVALYRFAAEKCARLCAVSIVVIALLLFFQPDASQLLAFCIPAIVLLLGTDLPKVVKGGATILLSVLTIGAWLRPDPLEPVRYTEDVLLMLREMSFVLYLMGIAALMAVPFCIWVLGKKKDIQACTGVALYYVLVIFSTFIGSFSVPFMGYGMSPILGFFLFLGGAVQEREN